MTAAGSRAGGAAVAHSVAQGSRRSLFGAGAGLKIRATSLMLLALTLAAVGVVGCSAKAEEPILKQFFAASRLRDKTALQEFSTVTFEPLESGIITTFEITGVTVEQSEAGNVTKNVTITAPVIQPDGQTVQKTLVVILELKLGRWLITGVAASRPPQRS